MDCAEFAVLLAAYTDRCGICGVRGPDARPPWLVIDHDHKLGDWAVRGMICSGCNRRIRDGVRPPAEAAAYLANPWFVRRLAERGLSPEPMPEPPVGTVIAGRKHKWERTERGWEPTPPGSRRYTSTWAGLNHGLGPYNIRIVRAAEAQTPAA